MSLCYCCSIYLSVIAGFEWMVGWIDGNMLSGKNEMMMAA